MNEETKQATTISASEVATASKPKAKKAKAVKAKPAAKAKPKAKSAKGERLVPANLSAYKKTKSASGNASFHNGDKVARMLDGKTLDDVYAIVAKGTKQDRAALVKRFKHLNVGMQRMNLGNVLRAAL